MIDQKGKFTRKSMSAESVGEAQEDETAVVLVIKNDVQLVYIESRKSTVQPMFPKYTVVGELQKKT